MKTFEIYWKDLTIIAKKRLLEEGFPEDDNINLTPLAIIEIEEEENE